MTQEDLEKFITWTKLKVKIHISERDIRFREREIWWCSLGKNIGYEEDGKNNRFERPILILKKFNRHVLWAIPLTRTIKKDSIYYYELVHEKKVSFVILSQLRLISSKRLLRRIKRITEEEFSNVQQHVKNLLK